MSTTIDSKVVEMRFDNQQFERNVSTSLSTLDKLKQSLKLTGATKGLEDVDAASKRINFTPLGNAVESVGLKFNAMYSIADQTLRNITTRVEQTAERMIKSLTIDPIKTGFTEYETQINAVQTILANTESKGTTLQDVNSALDTLNTYADKTIYNFTEMTRNIGTFTAAGVDLDTSVSAIQGIANLAAVSGSTSQQASTAMYQLSQALSSGTVKLMDWNSVVNAGMGGQVFQDALKRTATVMGTNVDALIKKNGSFRESLQEGWITADVLTATLNQFTMAAEEGTEKWEVYKASLRDQGYTEEQAIAILKMANTATDAATKVKTFTQLWDTLKESAQSGWTQSWEIIVGDFGEAKNFLTEISNRVGAMIGASADARNEMLSGGLSSGWKQLLNEGIADEEGYKDTLKSVAKEHNVAIDDMIAKEKELDTSLTDAEAFQKVLKKSLEDGTVTSDMMTESVHRMADKMSKMSAKELEAAGYTEEHVEQIKELSKGLKDGSVSMEEFTTKIMRSSGRENIIQALWNAFDGLMSVITPVKEAFREIFPPITGDQLYSFTETLMKLSEKLTISEKTADNLKRTFKGVFAVLDIGVQIFKALFGGFADLIGYVAPAGDGILGFTAKIGDFLVSVDEAVKKGNIFGNIIKKIGDFLKPIADGVKTFGKSVADSFKQITDTTGERLGILSILGKAIKAIFVGLAVVLDKLSPIFASIAKGAGELFSNLMNDISSAFDGADYNKIYDFLNGGIFTAIGIGIAKFVHSTNNIFGELNLDDFLKNIKGTLEGVKDAFGAFTQSLQAKTLKEIAVAIAILAGALLVLALIPSNKLTASLAAITTLFIELFGAMKVFTKLASGDGLKNVAKISAAMIAMSSALLILSIAMKILSTMSWKEMGVGLISVGAGLGALVGALRLLPENDIRKSAKALKKLASALVVYAIAMKILGSMSWKEMGVGLITMVTGLGAMVGALHLLPKDMSGKAGAMVVLASSMIILGTAMKIMGSISWPELGRGITALVVGLGAMIGALHLLPKDMKSKAGAMVILASAMVILGGALKIIGSMSWDELGRGLAALAGSLILIVGALALMNNAVSDAVALLIVSGALVVLAGAMNMLGGMSWEEVIRGLVSIAGVLVILGAAAAILGPLVGVIISLAGSVALFGLGVAALGAGVLLLGVGITALAAALAAGGGAIAVFVSSLIGLIPYLIEQIGVGIIKLCEVIAGSADAICKALTVIILALVDALVASVPAIVEGVFVLIDSLLESLVKHVPVIVGALYDLMIGIINKIAEKLPDLIQAGVNLLMAFFRGVVEALKGIDSGLLVEGIMAVGMLTALVVALAAVAALTPLAMVGVLGLGVVVTELAIVLAAIGALAQIPGLEWLIYEGGQLMQKIGTAIGQFLGGIVGGFAQGMSSALPQIGSDLSAFMANAMGFIVGVKMIDATALEGVKSLVGVILALTGANILESITSWLTGGSSLTKFGKEISEFAPYIKSYADTVKGIDTSAITASANAARTLSELASNLPNSGGLAGWFAGENDIGTFGEQLVPFGEGMKAYSDAITGFNPEAVIASANAAKAIADMSNHIPNQGGVVSWFVGDNSIASFGDELVTLGEGLKAYSDSIVGFNPEAVIASVNAAKAISDMTATIPNSGGMVAWFTGENSVAAFGHDLVHLGRGLKNYSDAIADFKPGAVLASVTAAKAIADLTNYIPNQGGIVAWFTGENSIASFGAQLPVLGAGLSKFSASVEGINPMNIMMAASAAKTIAQMADIIPNQGGLVAWFTGDNSLARFALQLPMLGRGLLSFSNSIEGMNPMNVMMAAMAAKSIAQMADVIPNQGGLVAWFTGENSIASFASQLPILGLGLAQFSLSVANVNAENIVSAANAAKVLAGLFEVIPSESGLTAWLTGENSVVNFASQLPILGLGLASFSTSVANVNAESMIAAAGAAKAIAEMSNYIPNEGGMVAWFTGENSIASFASQLPILGLGLAGFSMAVAGINAENVVAAANAAKALAEMANVIPNEGGIVAWFTGENSMSKFAGHLPTLGKGLKGFSDSVAGISPENVTAAASAAKKLAEMADTTPKDTNKIVTFGTNLVTFGGKLKSYFDKTSTITQVAIATSLSAIAAIKSSTSGFNASEISSTSKALDELVKSVKGMSKVTESTTSGFVKALNKLAEANIKSLLTAFDNAGSDLKNAGKKIMDKFVDGVDSKKSDVSKAGKAALDKFIDAIEEKEKSAKTACSDLVSACAKAMTKSKSKFESAGKSLVNGFAAGIDAQTWKAEAKAKAMAKAAYKAAKDQLDINSPSRVFRELGYSIPEGLAAGIDKLSRMSTGSAVDMANNAIGSVKSAINRVTDYINTDIDTQPTIRPVLDLSDVTAGAGAIGGLFNNPSMGVNAHINSISSMMSNRQNGGNTDVISAIDKLRKDLGKINSNTYQINGVSYDGSDGVAEAIETIARAALRERRI